MDVSVPDHLASLAVNVGILSPENPHLGPADFEDLAMVECLTSTMAYLEHSLGIEHEVVESETWNYDATVELLELAKRLGCIPFGGGTRNLFDTSPSLQPVPSHPTALQEALHATSSNMRPPKRTIFNLHLKASMDSWMGKYPGM
jgi:hypothetical protein